MDSLLVPVVAAAILVLLFLAVLFNPDGQSLSAQWQKARWLLPALLAVAAYYVVSQVVRLLMG